LNTASSNGIRAGSRRLASAVDTVKSGTAAITGSGSGIGRAIALGYAREGAQVVALDINGEAAAETASAIGRGGGKAHSFMLDVRERERCREVAGAIEGRFGAISILVNDAGINRRNAFTSDPEAVIKDWEDILATNLYGVFNVTHAFLAQLRATKGRIVNIASIAGKEGNPNASHYSASKAGVIALTKSLAKELAATGVLVNCVTPAAAKTELFAQMKQEHIDYMLSKIPMNRFVEVDEIAALVAWLASEDCSFSTGAVFDISGGRAVY